MELIAIIATVVLSVGVSMALARLVLAGVFFLMTRSALRGNH